MPTTFVWGLLGCGLPALGAYLGPLPGHQPQTIRETYERFRALDSPLRYRMARIALLLLSLACLGIAIRGL